MTTTSDNGNGSVDERAPGSLILARSTLEKLHQHATAAARIVGHIDALVTSPLADHIDAIAHELGELLGNPHLGSSPEAGAPDGRVAYDGARMLTSGVGGAV